ncbi:MAG: DNA polymerase III subunit alpha [Terriglobales bacterium]
MFIELHAASAFSFLRGASLPEELAERAAALEMPALALLDADGFYGVPRFHQACRRLGVRPLIGAEVTLEDDSRLPLLVASRAGYRALGRLLSRMHLRAPAKGAGRMFYAELAELEGVVALSGDEQGPLALALARGGEEGGAAAVERLAGLLGRGNVYLELQRHLLREQEARNQAALRLAARLGLPVVASNGVRYATPAGRTVLDLFTCLRHHTTLARAGRRLAPNAQRYLASAARMAQLFRDQPAAVERTAELAGRLEFTLDHLGYEFPQPPVPAGHTAATWLRELSFAGARRRYRPLHERARRQLEHELGVIERLNLAGYFLILDGIMGYCREHRILAQGRGSAANSAVCYSLGITAVDPVGMELLFERFLSEERGEWPDIDVDLPSGALREQVIQYVYSRYGGGVGGAGVAASASTGAAMTANVITYRGRGAAREVGKVLEFGAADIARLSALLGSAPQVLEPPSWQEALATRGNLPRYPPAEAAIAPALAAELTQVGFDLAQPRLLRFLYLCQALQDLPRHLGQHSGGMVLSQGPLAEIVPIEPASMPGRVVIQWDKEDCADLGIIKVDLLGLGMMAALQEALALARPRLPRAATSPPEVTADLSWLPEEDPAVYRALRAADTVGVFQVESRAQMATLPRLRPRTFYDLVIEVAIIRPGPITGDLVNPYLRRRAGEEPVHYAHPLLEPILRRTLGVPLFQEQLLKMAMVVAGFTGGQAEQLRRAMGFKRSERRMAEIEQQLRQGMARQGVEGAAADEIIRSITSFALYGFPESHAASFALLVYASAYLKVHFPEEFLTALLNHQPMGFYHPATLVADAQRHRVTVLPISVAASAWECTTGGYRQAPRGRAVRLGLRYVRGLSERAGRQLVAERQRQPFTSLDDLCRRVPLLEVDEARTLAELGAFHGHGRRDALWQIEAAHRDPGPLYAEAPPEEEEEAAPPGRGALVPPRPGEPKRRPQAAAPNDAAAHRAPGRLYAAAPPEEEEAAQSGRGALVPPRPSEPKRRPQAAAPAARPPFSGRSPIAPTPRRKRLGGPGGRAAVEIRLAATPARSAQSASKLPRNDAASPLPPMSARERMLADFRGASLTLGPHPLAFERARLRAQGCVTAGELAGLRHGQPVEVAGIVIARQRPENAGGVVFMSLEDETGIANVIIWPDVFARHRLAWVATPQVRIRGRLQRQRGVIHLLAESVAPLNAASEPAGAALIPARDFR